MSTGAPGTGLGRDGAGTGGAGAGGALAPMPKAVAYGALAAGALLLAVVLGDPAVVALGAPFGIALAIGLLVEVPAAPEVTAELEDNRLLEGGATRLVIEVTSPVAIRRVDLRLEVPDELGLARGAATGRAATGGATAWSLALDAEVIERLEVDLEAARFGRFMLGPVEVRVPGAFGLLVRAARLGRSLELEVRPRAESLKTLVRARDVRATAGDRLARRPEDGIEFAEVRPYQPGMPGRLNWRVTARRGSPHVSLRDPERSTDVVLLVDTFSPAPLARQVRAAAGLASMYLARHDRVGLVSFGGVLHWVEPAMGRAQLERIVTALAETEWHHSYAWKSAETIPARTLPATGLVIALSPLEDPRAIEALATIRSRGVDLAVIETAVRRLLAGQTPAATLAARIIAMERAELRDRFSRRGVPVVTWEDGEPLQGVLIAMAAWRRRARGHAARAAAR